MPTCSSPVPRRSVGRTVGALALFAAGAALLPHALPAQAEDAPPSVAPSPRRLAVEAEIAALERMLVPLRKVRADLKAGRAEAVPPSDEARAAHEVAVRGVREVLRYEAVRGRALGLLADALLVKDEVREHEARRGLDEADRRAVEGLSRIASAAAKSAEGPAADDPERKPGGSKSADAARPSSASDR